MSHGGRLRGIEEIKDICDWIRMAKLTINAYTGNTVLADKILKKLEAVVRREEDNDYSGE